MAATPQALILNYHLIDGGEAGFDPLAGIYAVRKADFEKQMQLLKDLEIPVVSLAKLAEGKLEYDFCVAITFDDGQPSDFKIAAPILKQLGFTATFFLSLLHFERENCDWKAYLELIGQGFEIGGHGITHRDLTTLDPVALEHELVLTQTWLKTHLGVEISLFSLPFGKYNPTVQSIAREKGYMALFSTAFEFIEPAPHSSVFGRWSIRRNTSLQDFRKIVLRDPVTVFRYRTFARLKRQVKSALGTRRTNLLNIYTSKP